MLREVASISFILPLVISDQVLANQVGRAVSDIIIRFSNKFDATRTHSSTQSVSLKPVLKHPENGIAIEEFTVGFPITHLVQPFGYFGIGLLPIQYRLTQQGKDPLEDIGNPLYDDTEPNIPEG